MNTDLISKALADAHLKIEVNDEGRVSIAPTALKFQSINVTTVREGMYISDPRLVPDELKDKNILWRDLPIEVFAVTEDGDEIPVFVDQVIMNHEERHPDERD